MAGELEYNAYNYMHFSSEESESSVMLEWWIDPEVMAKNLREAADWLEEHKNEKISVYID